MIPRNIFLMWDKPRENWPPLVRVCIELWIEINPTWKVEVYDLTKARELLKGDIDLDIFNSLKVQHQSDLVRTKLLSVYGGIWADASCLPHMPADAWIGDFDDLDYGSIPTNAFGIISDNWFLLSRPAGFLMTRQYQALLRYWQTPKINMPQDTRSIHMIAERWQHFVSDYAAHELRVAPYFLWQYLFRQQVESDVEFREHFLKQRYLSTNGECGLVINTLMKNKAANIPNNPLPDALRVFLRTTTCQLSKLNHHSHELDYPLQDFSQCVLERAARYLR